MRPDSVLGAPVEWRLHVGAHKTATTHLQRTLDALRPRLRESDVDALPTAAFRSVWSQEVRQNRGARKRLVTRGLPVARRDAARFAAALADIRDGGARVLISEENIIGDTSDAIGARPYAKLSERVRLLRALIGRKAAVRIFFSIRDMTTFLPSVYAEALRFFPLGAPFETLAAPALETPPRWTDIVEALRRAWPEAAISVWRYEDYQTHTPAILAHVTGCDPGPLPVIPRPRTTMTPSATAVRAVECDAGLEAMDIIARERRVGEIYAAAPANEAAPAFRPMTQAQAARCRAAYEADCAALEKSGMLFSP